MNEVDFLHADKYESFLQVDSMIFLGMVKDSQSSQKSKFSMSLQYLEKEVRDKVEFLHADKQVNWNTFCIKFFYKVVLSLMDMINNYQITQSNKLAPSTICHKRDGVRDGVYFLHADKYQSFVQVGIIILDGSGQTCPKYPK